MTTNTTTTKTTFIVVDKAAKMPSNCWGKYRRVAVLEVMEGTVPTMISRRARGVVRIIKAWEKLNVGTTSKCAFKRALDDAHILAAQMNADR